MNCQFKINFVLFCTFAFFMLPCRSEAQIYDTAGPSTFRVDSTAVISSPIPLVGDTVHMLIRFHANVTGSAVLNLGFTGHIEQPNYGDTETTLDSAISVDSGS